jgi:type I restriction enzyme S subunit
MMRAMMHEGWIDTTVGELAQINPESLGVRTPDDYEFGYIDLSMVNEGQISYPSEKIKYKNASPRARRLVKNGDILLATVRPNLKGFGSIGSNAKDLICSTGFAVLRCQESATADYLYQYIFSDFVYRQIDALVVGSNYPAINNEDVQNLEVTIPVSLDERHKIAAILRTWDDAIERQAKIVTLVQKKRKALLSKLLSEHAPNKSLRSFVKPVAREIPTPTDSYYALGLRSHAKGTFQRFIKDAATIGMESVYQVKENDLIVNITFAWEGAIALVKKADEHCVVSHRFPTFEIDTTQALPQFIRHVVQTKRFIEHLGIISPGGAGRNRVLSKKDFMELKIWLPDPKTQTHIADVISTVEAELEIAKRLLEKNKQQKRGLMQKLLTGQWRVKTSEQEAA